MAHTSSLVFTGIAPHPPIMVPEVGRDAIAEVRSSIDAMAELTERVIASRAETVVIISPHAPLEAAAFIAYDGPQLYGDFANFRAPTATIHAELDEELLNEITRAAGEDELVVLRTRGNDLDHGTAVPLYFLQRNGWQGRVIALGYSFLSKEDHVRFGKCIRQSIEKIGRRVAFIASGDLSHRLRLDAPAGYNPDAHLFDEEVLDAIRNCSTSRIVDIDQEMRRLAGECGYRSMLVAIGVAQGDTQNCEVISYEAPFGVGYLVAQLAGRADARSAPAGLVAQPDIPALARRAVEAFATTGKIIDAPTDASGLLSARAGCFVSIKTSDGELRGCIGTIDPVKDTLAQELILNAISSATSDPRFSPVRADELPHLKYSVDVLSPPEACTADDLDPKLFGVIVEEESGARRGLLLPNLPNIDTASKQIEMAARKAGIHPQAGLRLFRFRADRYSE
jgi:AmmeMemoRadiSam system protein A/AmmeMemoRadiSam system protein B